MFFKTCLKITLLSTFAILLYASPVEKAHADKPQCRTDATACANSAIGVALACAADAVVDGLTTAACVAAWVSSAGDCTDATKSCAQTASSGNVTLKPPGALLGNNYANSDSQILECAGDSRVYSVAWRLSPYGIVSIALYCSGGGRRYWDSNIVGTRLRYFSCDTGELIKNFWGVESTPSHLPTSLEFICDNVARNSDHSYSTSPVPSDAVLAGCPDGTYLSGLQIYYDPTVAGANLRYRIAQGIQAICR